MEKEDEVTRMQKLLEDLEAVAEDVLCDRQEIVSLDRRRNTNREAIRALKNSDKPQPKPPGIAVTKTGKPALVKVIGMPKNGGLVSVPSDTEGKVPIAHTSVYSNKTWMCIGDMFIRMPKDVLSELIEKEQHQLDKGINDLKDGLRGKVNTLRRLEGLEPTRGTFLSPLTKEEWSGVQHVIDPSRR